MIKPDATPTEEEVFALIFAPGFSTADKVTDVSGRGVGMDVVRRNIEKLDDVHLVWSVVVLLVLVATMIVQGGFQTLADTRDGLRSRSYFGIYTVRDHPELGLRTLAHGTTLHGQQALDLFAAESDLGRALKRAEEERILAELAAAFSRAGDELLAERSADVVIR